MSYGTDDEDDYDRIVWVYVIAAGCALGIILAGLTGCSATKAIGNAAREAQATNNSHQSRSLP